MDNPVTISYQDAQKISSVLELHICSGMARSTPEPMQEKIKTEIEQLNRIQKRLESQLDVFSVG